MSLLRDSVAVLNAGLKQLGGEKVTYRRGNLDVKDIIAVPVRTRHGEYGDAELALSARDADWIIWSADLVIEGKPILPERGDQLDWIDAAGMKHTFEVLPRGDDRCYRHTDQTRQQLRVYTVETQPGPDA